MAVADDRPPGSDLEAREPTLDDLRDLCRALNDRGARYVVIGGFAMRAAGYNRRTMDVDLIVAADADNETRVFEALATLPDQAVRELQPGELQQYTVIRVSAPALADEVGDPPREGRRRSRLPAILVRGARRDATDGLTRPAPPPAAR